MEPLKLMRRLEPSPSPRALSSSGEMCMSCMYRYPAYSLAFPTWEGMRSPRGWLCGERGHWPGTQLWELPGLGVRRRGTQVTETQERSVRWGGTCRKWSLIRQGNRALVKVKEVTVLPASWKPVCGIQVGDELRVEWKVGNRDSRYRLLRRESEDSS